jgi:hypothetical protein
MEVADCDRVGIAEGLGLNECTGPRAKSWDIDDETSQRRGWIVVVMAGATKDACDCDEGARSGFFNAEGVELVRRHVG